MASWEDWINRQIGGIEAHPWQSALEAAGIGAAVAFPFVAPEIAAGFGAADLGVGAAEAGAVGADVGLGAAEAGAVDVGAGAAEAGAAEAGAAGAGDFVAGAAETGAVDTIAPAAVDAGLGTADALNFATLGGENLGTTIGADTAGTLAGAAPTDALTAGEVQLGAPSAAANAAAAVPAGGGIGTPTEAIAASNANLEAALGGNVGGAAPVSGLGDTVAGAVPTDAISGGAADAGGGAGAGDTVASNAPQAFAVSANPAPTGTGLTGGAGESLGGAGPAPSTASGIGDKIGGVLASPYTKAAELALPLGFLGYNLLKGPPAIPAQTQQAVTQAQIGLGVGAQAQQNVPALQQTTAQNLANANANKLNPGQQADFDTQQQNLENQLYQQLANQGLQNVQSSSQWIQGKQQIAQQMAKVKQDMVAALYTTAFNAQTSSNAALGVENNANAQLISALQQAGAQQVASNTAFTNATASAMQSFGMMAALSGGFGSGRTQTQQVQNSANA